MSLVIFYLWICSTSNYVIYLISDYTTVDVDNYWPVEIAELGHPLASLQFRRHLGHHGPKRRNCQSKSKIIGMRTIVVNFYHWPRAIQIILIVSYKKNPSRSSFKLTAKWKGSCTSQINKKEKGIMDQTYSQIQR